ncbi:MAG: glycosyltransferase family 4 protein [Phycisphaerae bacterium]|nr:glycosyltransferase family 4 protein [Phycisphaerae bacterium]
MHVAYIHQHFATPQQADGTRSYELARALLAAGHRVTMIAGGHMLGAADRAAGRRVVEKTVDCINVKYIDVDYDNAMGPVRRWMAFTRFANIARELAVEARPDLVFATSTPLTVSTPGRLAAKKLKVPFIFEVRDVWPQLLIDMGVLTNPLAKWMMRRMELRAYRSAKHIVILAPGMRDHIVASGISADKLTFIPNSCDLDLFRPGLPRPEEMAYPQPGEFTLVFTGAHGRANGLEAVLDAAGELKRRGVTGVRFLFIGGGGMKPRLVQRATDEGLGGSVTFQDPIKKPLLARVLAHVNVGMQILANVPGFYNGTSPNKFFDYISSGLPVLNNYPGWLAELIKSHNCGLAVPPNDPKAFADAVLWMRDHPADLEQMGRNARALAEREFNRADMARRFVELLERTAAGG